MSPRVHIARRVDLNAGGWSRGVEVWPQITSRPVTVEFSMAHGGLLLANPAFRELMGSSIEARRAAYSDSAWRQRAAEEFARQTRLRPRWDTYTVTACNESPALIGALLSDIARDRGESTALEAALDLALAEPDLAVVVHGVVANDDPVAVAELLNDDRCTFGLSDAGAHISQLCDAAQATDFLGGWVRERNVMSWEQAVRKLSAVQADIMGFAGRGYLREGYHGDVVVFDPATVAPGPIRRVTDFPGGAPRLTADAPTGITHVLVNGTPIRRDGSMVSALDGSTPGPGRVVRSTPRGH